VKEPKVLGGECPRCGGVGGPEGQLSNVAWPSAASPVLSVAAAALRPPPLRSSGTEIPQSDFRQGRFVRAVTRSMCWQKFDPPLDPRTHLAIRFGSRNSQSMRFKRRPSSSQVTCRAKPLTSRRPRPWQGITHAMKSANSIPNDIRATAVTPDVTLSASTDHSKVG
jgi:hypothetical protein